MLGALTALRMVPGGQVIRYLFRHRNGDVFLSFVRGGAQMGRHHHLWQRQQRTIPGRLLNKHVKGGSSNNSRLDRVVKVLLIGNPAPSTVDDKDPLLHLLEGIRIQAGYGSLWSWGYGR